jgi:methylenetetrahydrofolate dehydrogenase (NADP+) / methenyltetrahydrofolate cyclohydrolase
MPARLIDGKAVAREVENDVRKRVAALTARGIRPAISVIRVGNDPASEVYVRNKARKAKELGIGSGELFFDASLSEAALLAEIARLNGDDEVDGILVQLPLPRQIDSRKIIEAIDPAKDVDGFHPSNVGRLHQGHPALVPCTPAGVIRLLESIGEEIDGKQAVVVGRSDIVGKPMAALLLNRSATVTICHSRTRGLASITSQADILVAAIGKPLMITAEMIKPGATVIDVGMNRLSASPENEALLQRDPARLRQLLERGTVLVGDVDYAAASQVAGWISPVPGGVGPMTIAMLMKNTVDAAERRRG